MGEHDSLVLNVKKGLSKDDVDTNIYILYDYKDEMFYIRGALNKRDTNVFTYHCKSMERLYDFVNEIFSKYQEYFEISMYSMKNLPVCISDITYSVFEEQAILKNRMSTHLYDEFDFNQDNSNNIFQLNMSKRIDLDRIKVYLRILKTVYNKY